MNNYNGNISNITWWNTNINDCNTIIKSSDIPEWVIICKPKDYLTTVYISLLNTRDISEQDWKLFGLWFANKYQ